MGVKHGSVFAESAARNAPRPPGASGESSRENASDPRQQRPEPIPPAILDPLVTTNLMCPAMKLRAARARSRNWTPGT